MAGKHTYRTKLMGCSFELGVICNNQKQANQLLEDGVAEIRRIEAMLTEFDSESVTSKLNNADPASYFPVPLEFARLMERCRGIHQLTKGYFDITVGPIKQLYRFQNSAFDMPSSAEIDKALSKVGMQKISLSPEGIKRSGTTVSFASIGKGYAADRVCDLWKSKGVQGGFINASGDLRAFGLNASGQPWRIGIADPEGERATLFHVPLNDAALATSGDYEQHFIHQGRRYSHNLDPLTGRPVENIRSISVISPSAELSDALATAVHAMGIKKGLLLIDQLPHTHMVGIDADSRVHLSKHLDYAPIH